MASNLGHRLHSLCWQVHQPSSPLVFISRSMKNWKKKILMREDLKEKVIEYAGKHQHQEERIYSWGCAATGALGNLFLNVLHPFLDHHMFCDLWFSLWLTEAFLNMYSPFFLFPVWSLSICLHLPTCVPYSHQSTDRKKILTRKPLHVNERECVYYWVWCCTNHFFFLLSV